MHSEAHTLLYGTNPLNRQKLDSKKLLGIPRPSYLTPGLCFQACAHSRLLCVHLALPSLPQPLRSWPRP